MQKIKSLLYGIIPAPETFSELIDLISFQDLDGINVHMWRGQSKIDWRIDHSAFRRLSLDKKKITDNDLIHYELNLLKQATLRGYRYQEGRILSDLELLAKLQHHGAATRLVDFSRSSLIGLWFACCNDLNHHGLLIGLHCRYLGGYESEPQDYEYPYKRGVVSTIKHPNTFEPPLVTPRIAAQHSQFVYSEISNEKTGSLKLHPSSKDETRIPNLLIAINKTLKITILRILEQAFDIRYQTLFPDIDGFGKANGHLISKNNMWRW